MHPVIPTSVVAAGASIGRALAHPVYDPRQVQVLDPAEHLVEQVGHPLVVQVHVDHLYGDTHTHTHNVA